MRYKVWRSNKDKELHLLCGAGPAALNALPTAIRHLGPWTGAQEGEIDKLRLQYRLVLAEQSFLIIYAHVTKLQLEAATVHALHPVNTECPECKGSGLVDQHGGLRQKSCPRCGGRGWVKAPLGR
jgi:hypothetical protein